jgi:hypothetical protein
MHNYLDVKKYAPATIMIVEASNIIFCPEQAISDYCCFFFLIKIAEIITPVPEIAITII